MFGESDTGESPRTPSPWEALENSPKSLPKIGNGVPKLVPENEEGNIEYKLQLLHPSPTRLARLTTQLKWRLLEGGGQAYYELGVADSGALIGLTRIDLEESLRTLDEMAGEIGASVVVVKEVEVPKGIGAGAILRTNGNEREEGVGEKARKYVGRKCTSSGDSSSASDGSPSPLDLDPSETEDQDNLFQMDLLTDQFDIEISTVYKPRPTSTHSRAGALPPRGKKKDKKAKAKWALSSTPSSTPGSGSPADSEGMDKDKSLSRRLARDRRREERQKALALPTTVVRATAAKEKELVEGLESLHVDVSPSLAVSPSSVPPSVFSPGPTIPTIDITSPTTPAGDVNKIEPPRLIVEALVFRKMALEEAFLDFEFGGFDVS